MRGNSACRSQSKGLQMHSHAAHQVLTVKIRKCLMALTGLGIEEKSLQMHSEHFPSGRPKLQGKDFHQILPQLGKGSISPHCAFLYPSHYIFKSEQNLYHWKNICNSHRLEPWKPKPRFSPENIKFFLSPTSGHYTSRDPVQWITDERCRLCLQKSEIGVRK